ncbi:hypothetical protein NBRC3293_1431 [Gluconobacter oxydans NBRC 3293]|uniref:Uncharacterized protein n=1 Tax=Gluconobacter oxydans NBRC 3293 TaxID=1315969 RepID=A0A829WUY9_GLUOY|nr:hypothetical protein NBRC3293_1431 [Gluconobacter oxydans NBRC 3293]
MANGSNARKHRCHGTGRQQRFRPILPERPHLPNCLPVTPLQPTAPEAVAGHCHTVRKRSRIECGRPLFS